MDDYFVKTYTGSTAITVAHVIANSNSELVGVGSVAYTSFSSPASDGWLAKFSANGTPLWSKKYHMGASSYVQLRDVVQASDETYFAIGQVTHSYGSNASTTSETRAVLLHIDKYGNLMRSMKYEAGPVLEMQTYFLSIQKISGAGFIINGTSGFNRGLGDTRGFYMLIDFEGRVKWRTYLSGSLAFPTVYRNATLQIQSTRLVGALHVAAISPPDINLQKLGYYFFCLDLQTGQRLWDKCYTYSNDLPDLYDGGAVSYKRQFPNGDLLFKSYYNDSVQTSQPPLLQKNIDIRTSNVGELKKSGGIL